MDLEQIRQDFKEGKMISKCTWALVLQAAQDMEDTLLAVATYTQDSKGAADCLGRVAAL